MAALQATRLNPTSEDAWNLLDRAAAFNGSGDLADAAFWKSLHVNPNNAYSVEWGLELYTPQWFRDPQKLRLVIQIIEADDYLFNNLHKEAIRALATDNAEDEAQALLARAQTRFREASRQDPKDPMPHYYLAYLALKTTSAPDYDVVVEEFKRYLALNPQDAEVQYELATNLYYQKKKPMEAEVHFRRAMALSPNDGRPLAGLGDIVYYGNGDTKTAERLYRRAIALGDNGYAYIQLAGLMLDKKKKPEALQLAKEAVRAGFIYPNPNFTRLGIDPKQLQQQLANQKVLVQ